MLPSRSRRDDISFLSVATKGAFKFVFSFLAIMILSLFSASAILSTMVPKNYSGITDNLDLDVVVTDQAVQPVTFTVSHDYPIEVNPIGFYITNGPDKITFDIIVRDAGSKVIHEESGSLIMPETIDARLTDKGYAVSDETMLYLTPGSYHIELNSTHPVRYSFLQEYQYELPMNMSILFAILGVLFLIVATIGAFRKRDELRKEMIMANYQAMGYGIDPGYRQQYTPTPVVMPASGQPSSIQYQNDESVDYICAKCGNIIQNPVVQNVITCEQCGEKEYVGPN